ncbi:MAG TPA: DNA polymerase III subunit delta [Vicinamibacterales bacterium]|nr:DNA polymerase III subunit delta [Vicinamibacterales bacterium]
MDLHTAVARRTPAPVYLLLGDDEAQMTAHVAAVCSLVDDELRAFNVERMYAGEKGVTPATIVESARQLPMMSDRRVVVVLRAEKVLKPKRRGAAAAQEQDGDEQPGALDVLEQYICAPEPSTTLVLVASDVDRSRRIWKAALQKHAVVVESWGLKGSGSARVDLESVSRAAHDVVRQTVARAGVKIEPAAARLVAQRAGTDISRLRGDLDRLLLYVAGRGIITVADAAEVVRGETASDDWAVANAIQRRNAAEALRHLALALDSGGVPLMILGQLAYVVRERIDPQRARAAVEALFRTDLEMKSSGGDQRVLLERLVVELCA